MPTVAALYQGGLSMKVAQLLGLQGPWWSHVCSDKDCLHHRSYGPISLFFFFFFSSTSLLLPTCDPPPSCTHAQSCNPMDCSQPGSSVHGLFQARILKWVAISFSNYQSFFKPLVAGGQKASLASLYQ